MHPLAELDLRHLWHPFTQMRDWLASEPVVIASGRGAVLRDVHGRRYLDANASIWTNLHGHRHPAINRAIRRQLNRIAHSSALGLANEPASLLGAQLIRAANPASVPATLTRVFYSDDGSTAIEAALKMTWEFSRRTLGRPQPRFVSLGGAYHGDTIGAVSLGHIDTFHARFGGLLFKSDTVMAPYCYRCPHNRGKPERADARAWRRCRWECVGEVERAFERARRRGHHYAALVVEPRMQGAAGMIPQPEGWLPRAAEIARAHQALVIADEVMTGFGRTGGADRPEAPLFASHLEGVQPDILCVAKGLSGGYLPMAATIVSDPVFNTFLGRPEDAFFHGHSYTANQLGAAASLASLELLQQPENIRMRASLERDITAELGPLWLEPRVGDIRQCGLVVGIELVRDWRTRDPFPARDRVGHRVCQALRARGVLTRPIGNVIVLMPPYCMTRAQFRQVVRSLVAAFRDTF